MSGIFVNEAHSRGRFARQGSESGEAAAPLPAQLTGTGLYVPGSTTEMHAENMPFSPQYPLWSDGADKERFIARTEAVNTVVHDAVASFGGSISAEHGIGQLRRTELHHRKPSAELELSRGDQPAWWWLVAAE